MAKGFSKKVFLQRQARAKRNRTIKALIFLLVNTVAICSICGCVFSKAHMKRECAIVDINENTIYVRHPNGLVYNFKTNKPELFEEDTVIMVSFNELKDWEKQYEINTVKPNITLSEINH